MGVDQFGLALYQVAAGQVALALHDLLAGAAIQHDGVAALAVDHGHHDVARGFFLEGGDQLGEVRCANERLVGQHDKDGVKRAAQRCQTDAHRTLLPLGEVGVVGQRNGEGGNLRLHRVAAKTRDHHHFVDTRAAERNQMPVDQRHALQRDQGLGHTAHAPPLARSQ